MAEIDRLLQSEVIPEDPFQWYRPPPETVSGGTLDRIKIAMQGRAADLNRKSGTADVAGGLFDRAADIDTALDAVPACNPHVRPIAVTSAWKTPLILAWKARSPIPTSLGKN